MSLLAEQGNWQGFGRHNVQGCSVGKIGMPSDVSMASEWDIHLGCWDVDKLNVIYVSLEMRTLFPSIRAADRPK